MRAGADLFLPKIQAAAKGRSIFMKHTKHGKRFTSPAGAILLGGGICTFSFLAVMLLSSMLILATKNPLANSDIYSPPAFALAGIVSGFLLRKCGGDGKILLFCPPLFILLGLLIGLFLSGGKISPSALLSQGIYLGAALLAFYLAKRKEGRRKRRKY